MEQSRKESLSPPYVSAKTLFTFLERLKQGLPTHVDRTMMNGYSGGVISQLTLAMKYLGLTGNNGETTDLLRDLVHADPEVRPVVLKKVLVSAYPFLTNGFDLATATTGTLNTQFRDLGVEGDTLRKCSTFLVAAAKEAGMDVSPHVKTGTVAAGTARPAAKKTAKRKPTGNGHSGANDSHDSHDPDEGGGGKGGGVDRGEGNAAPSWAKLLVDKMPPFDPTWSAEVQTKWFDAYARLMEMQPK